jgi:multicomponent Na+:H+ antiporter subunit G
LIVLIVDILSWLALGLGGLLCVIGAAGVLRFPDFYTRTHAASVTDTGGALLVLLGLMLQAGKLAAASGWDILATLVIVKLAMVAGFILLTSPTAGHALVKAAFASGLKVETDEDGLHRIPTGGPDDEGPHAG